MLEWLLVIGISVNHDRSSSNIREISESLLSWQSADFFQMTKSLDEFVWFFHAVARISYLKCLRCLLFHAPMTVNAYRNTINPVGCFKIFGYFHLTCLFWSTCKCKLQCKRSLYTNRVTRTKKCFEVAIKTSSAPSICELRNPQCRCYVVPC